MKWIDTLESRTLFSGTVQLLPAVQSADAQLVPAVQMPAVQKSAPATGGTSNTVLNAALLPYLQPAGTTNWPCCG